jgi:hypothetical protein
MTDMDLRTHSAQDFSSLVALELPGSFKKVLVAPQTSEIRSLGGGGVDEDIDS